MKQYRITLEGQTFDVKVLDDPRRERVRVEVDGEVFTVGVESVPMAVEVMPGEASQITASSPPALPSIPTSAELADHAVVAPLPGVIKTIAVRPGQRVSPNDELVIIEAMKMDNVIRATRTGVIGTIYVTEGRQVAYGEPMLDYAD
jgi:biotin carboxyl carrier protein